MEKRNFDKKYDNKKFERRERPAEKAEPSEGLVVGRNAVRELLKSGRDIDKLMVQRGEREGSITVLIAEAKNRGIPVVDTEKQKLDFLACGAPHQGVIAMAAEKEYSTVEDILVDALKTLRDCYALELCTSVEHLVTHLNNAIWNND